MQSQPMGAIKTKKDYSKSFFETYNQDLIIRDYKKGDERFLELFNKKSQKVLAKSVLIYGAQEGSAGHLFVIYMLDEKPLYKYSIYSVSDQNTFDLLVESDFKFLNWRSANLHGMKIFRIIDDKNRKQKYCVKRVIEISDFYN